MSVLLNEHKQWLDGNLPIVNGKVFVGTQGNNPTTGYPDAPVNLITIYSDRELTTAIANPQATDADGRTVNKIWIPDVEYSLVVWDSDDVQKYISLNEGKTGSYEFGSVTELIAQEGSEDGQIAYLKGYYAVGDGGGGPMYWDATSTETADDGMIFQVTGVTTGRWKRPDIGYWGEWDVRKGGVIGDAREVSDANITTGTNTLTSATAAFTSSDVGKSVAVFNAGATTTSLFSTISGVTGGTTATLADNAGTTVSGVTCQIGTDSTAKMHSIIDAVHSAGGGFIKAVGKFFTEDGIQLRASNVVYDFSGATFMGNGVGIADSNDLTKQHTNIIGLGGTFSPIGDTISAGSTNYNALYVVIADGVQWISPKVKARQGTRGLSIQTDTGWGVTPFQNIDNVSITDIQVIGDGLTNNGLDITSSGADDMIQHVNVTGEIKGCDSGINTSTGATTEINSFIELDIVVYDSATIGASLGRSKMSNFNVSAYGCLAAGVTYSRNEECSGNFKIYGTGTGLTTALFLEDNSIDTINDIDVVIGYDGTNEWTTGINPSMHDVNYNKVFIDGAVTGIDTAGFRSVWGNVTFRNCTTLADTFIAVTDSWGTVIDLDTGVSPTSPLRASGTSSILSTTTSIAVTHGLPVTPPIEKITITAGQNPTNDIGHPWISGITSTQFTVNVRADPGASDWGFGWAINI